MKGATNREVPSALAMATLLGASSPKTTCKKVMVAKAKAKAMASVKPSGTERAMNRGSRRCLKAGSPIHPKPSEELVIPSWHTERYESSLPVASLRSPDEVLPSRTSPNSAATNRPFRATKNSAKTTRRPLRARLPNPYPRLRIQSAPAEARAPFLYSYPISRRCPESYADQQRITSGRRTGLHSPRAHPRQSAEGVEDSWRSSAASCDSLQHFNFAETRICEVRLVPSPMGGNFSGSCIVTNRNPLIHIGATTATRSERFGAGGLHQGLWSRG